MVFFVRLVVQLTWLSLLSFSSSLKQSRLLYIRWFSAHSHCLRLGNTKIKRILAMLANNPLVATTNTETQCMLTQSNNKYTFSMTEKDQVCWQWALAYFRNPRRFPAALLWPGAFGSVHWGYAESGVWTEAAAQHSQPVAELWGEKQSGGKNKGWRDDVKTERELGGKWDETWKTVRERCDRGWEVR